MPNKVTTLCLLAIFLFGCTKQHGKSVVTAIPSIDSIIEKKLGEHFESETSEDGTYVLYKRIEPKSTTIAANKVLRFVVVDLRSSDFIYEDNILRGSVKWLGSHELLISYTPGTAPDINQTTNEVTYIYDLLKRTRKTANTIK